MNKMKFLGTAGARFVVTRQLRKSGGIWLTLDDTNILIDPGPGSLNRCFSSKPKLNPLDLDGIILTHRHLDHSNDINIIIEAMTNGGFKKKGIVFAPQTQTHSFFFFLFLSVRHTTHCITVSRISHKTSAYPPVRIRGSTSGYTTSTMRFAVSTANIEIKAIP